MAPVRMVEKTSESSRPDNDRDIMNTTFKAINKKRAHDRLIRQAAPASTLQHEKYPSTNRA
jgi:hypothetical protein